MVLEVTLTLVPSSVPPPQSTLAVYCAPGSPLGLAKLASSSGPWNMPSTKLKVEPGGGGGEVRGTMAVGDAEAVGVAWAAGPAKAPWMPRVLSWLTVPLAPPPDLPALPPPTEELPVEVPPMPEPMPARALPPGGFARLV
jgi:hypothetical protein